MLFIGCDLHSRYQQVAMAQDETGELAGGRLLTRRVDFDFVFSGWPTVCGFVSYKRWVTPSPLIFCTIPPIEPVRSANPLHFRPSS